MQSNRHAKQPSRKGTVMQATVMHSNRHACNRHKATITSNRHKQPSQATVTTVRHNGRQLKDNKTPMQDDNTKNKHQPSTRAYQPLSQHQHNAPCPPRRHGGNAKKRHCTNFYGSWDARRHSTRIWVRNHCREPRTPQLINCAGPASLWRAAKLLRPPLTTRRARVDARNMDMCQLVVQTPATPPSTREARVMSGETMEEGGCRASHLAISQHRPTDSLR